MEKIIGSTTTCNSDEHPYLKGYTVHIIAVIKNAARLDYDPDEDDTYITDDEDLARAGGVTSDDRVEVQPWIEKEGRFSFVSSDPKATDLACFADLNQQEAAMTFAGNIKRARLAAELLREAGYTCPSCGSDCAGECASTNWDKHNY